MDSEVEQVRKFVEEAIQGVAEIVSVEADHDDSINVHIRAIDAGFATATAWLLELQGKLQNWRNQHTQWPRINFTFTGWI